MIRLGGPNGRSPSVTRKSGRSTRRKLAADRQAAIKAENPRAKGAVAAKRPIDRVADYARRMVDLAESSPDDPAARDALLWVINEARQRRHGGVWRPIRARRGAARPPSRR